MLQNENSLQSNQLEKKLDKTSFTFYIYIMNDRNWGGKRTGSGRKATGRNIVNITLTLTKNEAQTLKERAEYDGLSVSRFISKYLNLNILPENLSGGVRLSDKNIKL